MPVCASRQLTVWGMGAPRMLSVMKALALVAKMDLFSKSLTADDEFSFETHEEIKRYFEENFHTSLDKDERKRMHTENPALHTTAMKVPKVNQFVLDHLGQRFPYACDNE